MSSVQPPAVLERRPSPLNLSSNNPFRNRAASPALDSPNGAPRSASSLTNRPMSTNPFLGPTEGTNSNAANASPEKADYAGNAAELFDNLNLDDKPPAENAKSTQSLQRAETLPAKGHRSVHLDEQHRRRDPRSPARPLGPGGSNSPEKGDLRRRNRRNSESSVMDKPSSMSAEERRRRERRHRERERERPRRGESKSSRPPRKPKGLDVIDKLDVTGIYGPGLFHHDGPFDACNPHRNRKKDMRAPMEAFPVGSANNVLGGAGPVHNKPNFDRFHGRGAEAFIDYGAHRGPQEGNRPPGNPQTSFNPKDRSEPVHGEESMGLGTSTFLEGAPASRTAMQRRDSGSADAGYPGGVGGLTRKISLAQRIRGISQPRRPGFGDGQRVTSPDARYDRAPMSPDSPPFGTQSAGGRAKTHEQNPFFEDYDGTDEKKGSSVKVTEKVTEEVNPQESEEAKAGLLGSAAAAAASAGGDKSPHSPRPLVRSVTNDDAVGSGSGAGAGGFLSRVKSLKGGKRARPEIRA